MPLTPKQKKWLKIGGIVAAGIGGIALLATQLPKIIEKTYLNLSVGEHGSTEPSAGLYYFSPWDVVKVKAIPESGYGVNWTVDGVSQGTELEKYITMNESHDVVVTFTDIIPPVRVPFSLENLTMPPPANISLKQKYTGYFSPYGTKMQYHAIPVQNYVQDDPAWWDYPLYEIRIIQFRVLDIWSEPCANIPITLTADESDYNQGDIHIGKPKLLEIIGNSVKSLEAISGNDGVVSFPIVYHHLNRSKFSKDRIYLARQWFPLHNWTKTCMEEGLILEINPYGMIYEVMSITMDIPCPLGNPVIWGPQYEFETFPLAHTIRATYMSNQSVANFCNLNCWFGIRAPIKMTW